MKGVILQVLERALREGHGSDTADRVAQDASLPHPIEATKGYQDSDLLDLIEAAEARLPGPPEEIRRRLGREALSMLAVEYPSFFRYYDDVEDFARNLDDTIHPLVENIFPDARFPRFELFEPEEGFLGLVYRSDRELCHLAEGLLLGTADRFEQTIEIEQPACTHDGQAECRLVLKHEP